MSLTAKHPPNYSAHRSYRDRIIEIHQEIGLTVFSEEAQFWTLGGPEHHEYLALQKHLIFGPNSYHTVDRGPMADVLGLTNPRGIVAHPHTEFGDCYKIWENPVAISYDSTEIVTCRGRRNAHDQKILDLVNLTRLALAASTSTIMAVHANYMLAYPGTKRIHKDGLFFKDDFLRWVSIFQAQFHSYDVDIHHSQIERMEGSMTDMIDLHVVLRR